MWTAIIGGVTSIVGSFFGLKGKQAEQVTSAINAVEKANSSASSKEKAIATIVQSEARSGYWLAAVWRPMLMTVLSGIVVAYAFGFTTPNMMTEMPEHSMISQLFELLKIGIMGYIPARTIEKIVSKVSINKLIEKFIKK